MTVKELEENFEILSQQFEERIRELSYQSVETQELLRMIGERLGRMEANNMTWEQFKRALQTRFGSLEEANAGGTLSKLLQTGTVKNYQLQFERSSSTLPGPSQLASTSRAHTSSTPSLLGLVPPGLLPYHRLSAAEQAEKGTKGLSFNCDEQFKPGHRCKTPQLLLLEADVAKDAELEDEYDDASLTVKISLKALTGLSPQNTMRDRGVINSSGKCYDVPVSIQGFQFQLDFYLLPVSGCDIVLGAEWLQSLGVILWDFSKLTMQFSWKGHNVQLSGNGSSPTVLANQGEDTKVSLPPIVSEILDTYSEVFSEPKGLPPQRSFDHHIPLITGSSPVNRSSKQSAMKEHKAMAAALRNEQSPNIRIHVLILVIYAQAVGQNPIRLSSCTFFFGKTDNGAYNNEHWRKVESICKKWSGFVLSKTSTGK
ncbi:hypothetical protein JRO89_XS09G0205300 [Xanthoceras sorbifolium]|uniref:Retrotransposon gag domain-containing protein n=1 Tax=Xanthoceras sorbifolium TaxID=99658 RepID=A0ABQ8HM39_9ROSI|nr:hypothetical protein JRO89_XS09G0205300 [Xanthoceras sorbifolium]